MIGLSGLITPSLDEMVHVANEMKRSNMTTAIIDRWRNNFENAYRS